LQWVRRLPEEARDQAAGLRSAAVHFHLGEELARPRGPFAPGSRLDDKLKEDGLSLPNFIQGGEQSGHRVPTDVRSRGSRPEERGQRDWVRTAKPEARGKGERTARSLGTHILEVAPGIGACELLTKQVGKVPPWRPEPHLPALTLSDEFDGGANAQPMNRVEGSEGALGPGSAVAGNALTQQHAPALVETVCTSPRDDPGIARNRRQFLSFLHAQRPASQKVCVDWDLANRRQPFMFATTRPRG
jgi:hypothetical protein